MRWRQAGLNIHEVFKYYHCQSPGPGSLCSSSHTGAGAAANLSIYPAAAALDFLPPSQPFTTRARAGVYWWRLFWPGPRINICMARLLLLLCSALLIHQEYLKCRHEFFVSLVTITRLAVTLHSTATGVVEIFTDSYSDIITERSSSTLGS